jgi:autotransporter-associated beta strand protein
VIFKGANTFRGSLTVQSSSRKFQDHLHWTSLEAIAQDAAGASPLGDPVGTVSLHTALLKITGAPNGQPITKGLLSIAGESILVLNGQSGPASLTVASLDRHERAVMKIDAVASKLGDAECFNILDRKKGEALLPPWLVGLVGDFDHAKSAGFLSYDPAKGVVPFSAYATDPARVGEGDVLRIGATELTGQKLVVQDLCADGIISGTGSIRIVGGGLLSSAKIAADIDFGDSEGIVCGGATLAGKVSGKNGVTFASQGDLDQITLLNLENDFTGPITINGSSLKCISDSLDDGGPSGSLGNLSNEVLLNNGDLMLMGRPPGSKSIGLAASRTIHLGPEGGVLRPGAPYAPFSCHIAARVTGPGCLTQDWDSSLIVLDNPRNDYSGGTKVIGALDLGMIVSAASKLGTGPVEVDPESALTLWGDHNIDSHARLQASQGSLIYFHSPAPQIGSLIGGGKIYLGTQADPKDSSVVPGDTTLTVGSDNSDFAFYGTLAEVSATAGAGRGSLRKIGTGTWTLFGNHAFTGSTVIEAGQLNLRGELAGNVMVQAGAALSGPGCIHGELMASGTFAVALSNKIVPMSVEGRVTLGGSLDVRLAPGVEAKPGQTWTVLIGKGGITGQPTKVTDGYAASVSGNQLVIRKI